jgi:hypothetical protein
MKLIFLDIDGVLNSTEYFEREGKAHVDGFDYPSVRWWAASIDPHTIRRLNRLIRDTGADVIISSSWRSGLRMEYLQEVLETRGFRGRIIGETPQFDDRPRCDEIVSSVMNLKPEAYVVFDDDEDAEVPGKFVRTSELVGLTDADVAAAKKILGE